MTAKKRNRVKATRNANYLAINRAAYEQLADQYAQRIQPDTDGDTKLMAAFFLLLSERFQHASRLRLLDIGCGNGLNLRMMLEHGHRATGIELSPKMAALAKHTAPGAQIILGDFLASKLPAAYFHGIFAKAIFHLFPKRSAPKFLTLVHRSLRHQGIFYITTTAEEVTSEGYAEKHDYAGMPVRFRARWTVEELRRALLNSNFVILKQTFDTEPSRAKTWINFWATKT